MRKISLLFFIIISVLVFIQAKPQQDLNIKEDIELKIDALLSKMTIEEKIGQMTQITLEVVSVPDRKSGDKLVIDKEKLREAIVKYNVGSILNTGNFANSLDNWHEIITAIQDIATKDTRLKIPVIYGIDAIHGANYTLGATIFPQSFALAATRNKEIVKKGAAVTAYEMKASGIPWDFNPVMDIGREPLWPRFFETFGEDPYLAAILGEQYVKGIQGDDPSKPEKGAACLKHYVGYSAPNNGKDRTPAWIPERVLRDVFLPSFERAVKAGALTVMVNSSEINGIPVHSDYHLLTEILKEEMNFQGFVVSDWRDIINLYERDRVAETPEEAVRMAVMAGIDMSMVPFNYTFYDHLLNLVNNGKVPVSRIDDAVRRILRVKFLTGIFENPYPIKSLAANFASPEFAKINKSAADEAITLLKNDNNILPLKKGAKFLVTGPTANKLSVMNGGWSFVWQGDDESLYPAEKNTMLEAMQIAAGNENVVYSEGVDFSTDINMKETIEKAKDTDYILLCLGEKPYCETPGNIGDLNLDRIQLDFANELAKTGKPVILVLFEGRPRVINQIVDDMSAIIMGYLPGLEGANSIADILFGDVNPSGILSFTYPKFPAGYTTYDYKPMEEYDQNHFTPQWVFGYGLSYTTFEYSDLKVAVDENAGKIDVAVKVKNTGKRKGKVTAELYLTDLVGSVSRPVRQLKGFEKIELEPETESTVHFVLTAGDLAFHNRENKKVIEPGDFVINVGGLEEKVRIENIKL